ncbi:MAG: WYL domain-containing protein [Lachnospiraceae bacterium]|nr:WYL domain-containing protein [Lachnospiraceae bacterium]
MITETDRSPAGRKAPEALLTDNDLRNLIKQFEIPLIYYALMISTDEDHAMSCSAIAEKLSGIVPHPDSDKSFFNSKTTGNKLEDIMALSVIDDKLIKKLSTLFSVTFGGTIKSREADGIYKGKNLKGSGSQRRYYFEPLLSRSDMDLVYGAINSSRYLSGAEKNYLLSRLEVLQPLFNAGLSEWEENRSSLFTDIESLPARPHPSKISDIPGSSSVMLRNTQVIYDAIDRKKQIEVIYGSYDIKDATGRVTFKERNTDSPYILNPYALLWNDGEYYLVATHHNHKNPAHLRVDRIIKVRIHSVQTKNGDLIEANRQKTPETLSRYFRKNKKGRLVFDSVVYANTFPQMIYSQEENLIDVTFECTSKNLQVIVDSFGTNISLSESTDPHEGAPGNDHYLKATVRRVQYDNAKNYALAHAHVLKLLSPENLVREVSASLKKCIPDPDSIV